jgi:hypothetical protein
VRSWSSRTAAGLAAVGVPGDAGPGAVFSSTARQADRLGAAAGARVGAAALDLLTVALAGRLDRPGQVPADSSRRVLLLGVRASSRPGCPTPELTPAAVARAHHVSLRWLYRLFEQEPTSVAGLIRERRPRIQSRTRSSSSASSPGVSSPPVMLASGSLAAIPRAIRTPATSTSRSAWSAK